MFGRVEVGKRAKITPPGGEKRKMATLLPSFQAKRIYPPSISGRNLYATSDQNGSKTRNRLIQTVRG